MTESVWNRLAGGLIVSCQTLPGEPLHGDDTLGGGGTLGAVKLAIKIGEV